MFVRLKWFDTHSWTSACNHPDTSLISQKSSHKFLGVIVDEHFNWKKHIELLTSKLQSLSYVFKRLVKYADEITVKTAYYGYVQSKLVYGLLALSLIHI